MYQQPYISPEKFIEIDGIKICYIEDGHGPTIIFVHGLGGSIETWDPTFAYFKTRFHTIAIDLPGFGKSAKPDIDYSIPFYSDTVVKFMEAKRVNKAVIVGNSMGGLIAIDFSRRYSAKVSGIVLVNGIEVVEMPIAGFALKLLFGNILTNQLKKFFHWSLVHFPTENLVRYFFKKLISYQSNVYTERVIQNRITAAHYSSEFPLFLNALVKSGRALLGDFPKKKIEAIKVPTLIICGPHDRLIGIRHYYRFHKQVATSSLVVMPDCGHVPQLERPELFNRSVESFLTGLLT